jgi:hypothetical protein
MESSAEAVDSGTGTTRMQLGFDNLKRGVEIPVLRYGSVESCERCPAAVHSGERAVVDQGDRVHFKRVAIARDLGKEGRDKRLGSPRQFK